MFKFNWIQLLVRIGKLGTVFKRYKSIALKLVSSSNSSDLSFRSYYELKPSSYLLVILSSAFSGCHCVCYLDDNKLLPTLDVRPINFGSRKLTSTNDHSTVVVSPTNLSIKKSFVADAAEIALPSVVNIVCPIPNLMGSMSSSGSGFIISKDGFIVTNAHVIAGSKDGKVTVTMSDLSKKSGYVHSLDDKTDIALIKLNNISEDLPIAKFGQSHSLRVGDFVVALGSPLYLQNTVTFGIVSSLSRHGTELGMTKSRNEYIQTDAAINVGNSGGPLVNIDGEVIGINVMKAQGVDGISFAIPIDTASQVISQLRKNKKVIRPYIGIKMASVIMSNKSYPQVLIQVVELNSPAYQAGINSGDIIIEVNGKSVKDIHNVIDAIGLEVGRNVTFRIMKSNGIESVVTLRSVSEN